jgi:hypothetical protein
LQYLHAGAEVAPVECRFCIPLLQKDAKMARRSAIFPETSLISDHPGDFPR